jgi:hydrogenase maturation factor
MTKWAGLEGTTTIARARPEESRAALGEGAFREVLGWLDNPGISIVSEGRALEGLPLTSGHDPTEGGVAMGIQEICRRSGAGAIISLEALPVRQETRILCSRYGMDPLGLLSSGVFLFTAERQTAEKACSILRDRGIAAAAIGEILGSGEGVWVTDRGGGRKPLAYSAQDEIVKLSSRRP